MKVKFGKVYIVERETAVGGAKMKKPKLLESISFSNTDYKWYDSDGKLSPLYKKYTGRPFSIQFTIKQQDKDGKEVEFQANLNQPYKLGQIAHQDFESVPTVTKELTERWESIGILTGDVENNEDYRVVRDVQAANFVASTCPGWKISEMKVLLLSLDPFFVIDEYIDKATSQKDTPFKLSQPVWSLLNDILDGKRHKNNIPKLPDSYTKLIHGVEELRDAIYEKELSKQYLIRAYKAFHDGMHFENCQEWKHKQSDKTSLMYNPTQQELRLISCGARAAVEMILYDQDIQVNDKIRESFLFESLLRAHAKSCALTNDLMSLKKEMADDETGNMVYFFHMKDGLSLEKAFQKAVDEINLSTKIVNETGELLISIYGEFEETQKLVDIVKNTIGGNMQWCIISNRYHPDIISDCIIELE